MTRLWLIGMMGTGKTSAGRLAADTLGIGFADTDQLVESQTGRPISEIWGAEGEASFRAREKVAMASLNDFDGIVATGGGVVLDAENRKLMNGDVVWLEARASTIVERVTGDTRRPLLADVELPEDGVATLLSERAPMYQALSTHRVVTDDRDVDEVAAEIVRIWSV